MSLLTLMTRQLLILTVTLPGGSTRTFEIDSASQVGEVIALLSAKISLPDPVGFALYEVIDPLAKLGTPLS